MVVLGISSNLSGHSTGGWVAVPKCGTGKAYLFISTYHPYSFYDGSAPNLTNRTSPVQGMYIDLNKDNSIRDKTNTNNLKCSINTAQFGDYSGVGTTSTDYFPQQRYVEVTDATYFGAAALPTLTNSISGLGGYSSPTILDLLKGYLTTAKGLDATTYEVANMWDHNNSQNFSALMVVEIDMSQLPQGQVLALVATSNDVATPVGLRTALGAKPCSGNDVFYMQIGPFDAVPSNFVSLQNAKVSLDGNCKKTVKASDLVYDFKSTAKFMLKT